MKNLIAAVAAVIALAGPAFAADMPLKAPPPPPPAFTWTGVYGGGFIGGLWEHTDNTAEFFPITFNQSGSTAFGGGMVGIQYQFGNFVIGAEGNLAGVFNRNIGSASCSPPGPCAPGLVATESLTNEIWTIGGRGGWAIGRWMPYVAGGYANASFTETFCIPAVCNRVAAAHDGAYVGAGIDWAVWGPWVAGFEYRHYWFDNQTLIPVGAAGPIPGSAFATHPQLDTAVFRLSYLFNVMGR